MKSILIVGTGTIGKPLIRLALEIKRQLGVEEVIFHKNQPDLSCRGMLQDFHRRGAKLAVYAERRDEFRKMLEPCGFETSYTLEEAVERADIIVDCTSKGVARKLKDSLYKKLIHPGQGFIAQGSERGFGKPYAFDINDQALDPEKDKFLQVVSCNTHQILCVLKTLAFDPYNAGRFDFSNLIRARFYLARRAGDISQDKSTIGIEVGDPAHEFYGSHQAEDAMNVLRTINAPWTFYDEGLGLDIHSAADTVNNPFMHTVYFSVIVSGQVTKEEVERRFRANPLTAVTYQKTNNQVFSEGRDRGDSGRILNQTVVCLPSLEVLSGGREIIGRCFTPQDGNALLSSVAAILWLIDPSNYKKRMADIFFKPPYLFEEV